MHIATVLSLHIVARYLAAVECLHKLIPAPVTCAPSPPPFLPNIRVLFSWGDTRGNKGFFLMTNAWFDEYLFQVD